jgi:hydroxymethylbilane synthase
LALAQAEEARARLVAAHPELGARGVAIVPIKTTGDKLQGNLPPSERERAQGLAGNKGLFTKEIEEALLAGQIDLAVHSMKDLPSRLPDGLIIAGLLPREDPRDALIVRSGANPAGSVEVSGLAALPSRAKVGTSSLRRQAQLLYHRPDLEVIAFRGNVETRLNKLERGLADATVLALAGLRRLGREDRASCVLDPSIMLPAVAQGAIGIEARADDEQARTLAKAIDHAPTAQVVAAERALLAALEGDCRTPIAALAEFESDGRIFFRAAIFRPDGSDALFAERRGLSTDAAALGREAGQELKRRGPQFFGA